MMECETKRLKLRGWQQADFEAYAGYYGDVRTAKFVGGLMPRAKAWRHFAAVVGHWTLKGFGFWAVDEKATGDFVGCVGLWEPEGWPEIELGYWLMPAAHGKGYATEAALCARRFAFEEVSAKTLVSYIDPGNAPSIKVAERLGAQLEATIELLDLGAHHVYRHPAPVS